MTTNPKDTGGNVAVDFVWGPFPVQPDEARTVTVPSGDAMVFGKFVGSDVLDAAKDNHVIATGTLHSYPANDLATLVTVPDLRGKTQAAATTVLTGLGLTADVAFGTFKEPVWGQQPFPGAKVAPGAQVHLTGTPSTSDTSQKIAVANVVGNAVATARTTLVAQGFTTSGSPTTVATQTPAAGALVAFGSNIVLA